MTNTLPVHTSKSRQFGRTGVSLIDVTVTVMIIGIMAAVAVPRFSNALRKQRALSAAERIAADLEFARERAAAVSAEVKVTFDAPNGSYVFSGGVSDPDKPAQPYEVSIADWPYEAGMSSVTFNGGSAVTFNGAGYPDESGTVVVNAGSFSRTVTLDAQTGRASVD